MLPIIILFLSILIGLTLLNGIDRLSKGFILSFQLLWALVLCVSTTQPYDLYLPSDFTYWLLLSNVIFFSIGFLVKKTRARTFNLTRIEDSALKILNNKVFVFLVIISCLLSAYYFSIFLAAASVSSSLGDVRMDFYSGELYGPFYDFINGLLLNPFQIICYPLVAIAIMKKKKIAIPLLAFLIFYNSLAGGRIGYVRIFFSFIFLAFCVYKLNLKKIFALSLGAIVLFLGLSYVSAERSHSGGDVKQQIEKGIDETFEHITTYACGADVALDYAIENNYVERIGGYGYGGFTATSVLHLVYIISNKLGMRFTQPIIRLAPLKQDNWIHVGHGHSFNALYTSVLFFYLDFGILGVIIIPFILGFICRCLINKLLEAKNVFFLIIVNYIFILALSSILDYTLRDFSSITVLVILYILGKKNYANKVKTAKSIY